LGIGLADITGYIKRDYAPIEERLRKLIEYERGIPRLIEQVIALFEPPLSKPIVEVAIEMISGQARYMRNALPETVKEQVSDESLLSEFGEANMEAVDSIEGFVGYLKGQLDSAKDDFAIGAAMFERMLAAKELVDLPLEHVLAVGRADL